jgi:hypothetical protein
MREKNAYPVREIASLSSFSRQTVTRMFERERGVLIMERPEKHAETEVPKPPHSPRRL